MEHSLPSHQRDSRHLPHFLIASCQVRPTDRRGILLIKLIICIQINFIINFGLKGVPTFFRAAKSVEASVQESGQMHQIHPANGQR
jgi:hypothetical protein